MMGKGESTKIESFMTPAADILCWGRDHINHIVKMLNFIINLNITTGHGAN